MSDDMVFPVPKTAKQNALIDNDTYLSMYEASLNAPENFWREHGQCIDWIKPYSKVKDTHYSAKEVAIKWYEDGTLNASANCIDRHLADHAEQVALIWEGDDPKEGAKITYRQLHEEVCRFANVLKARGVQKGDRVTIYMPMIPEAVYAMLACARIGAVHSVVFGGFSPDALAGRILDCDSHYIITADEGIRGGKTIALKANVDAALAQCPEVKCVFMVRRTGAEVALKKGRDVIYQEERAKAASHCPPEEMKAEDPLFILYTSGSTGKPKGVLHTTGGYMVYAAMTHKYIFDYQAGDIYWCTADVGWVTGHSYIVYGPLANGATTLIFEGVPTYPDNGRFWQVCDKHKVTIFYTAPTALRALMAAGDTPVKTQAAKLCACLARWASPLTPKRGFGITVWSAMGVARLWTHGGKPKRAGF